MKKKVIGIEVLDNYPYYEYNNKQYPITYDELVTFIPTFVNEKDKTFHIIIRFFLINAWIKKYGYLYRNILICDIKDILFQKIRSLYIKKMVYIYNLKCILGTTKEDF